MLGSRLVNSGRIVSQIFSRSLANHAVVKPIPSPTSVSNVKPAARSDLLQIEAFPTPAAFLSSIGRSSETKVKVENWEEFWQLDGHALRGQGLAVRDRRYILWAMEKFRQGEDPVKFAHEPKKKKKTRGRGPAVQNGKRIRSRRKQ